jgi:hypothetical protein
MVKDRAKPIFDAANDFTLPKLGDLQFNFGQLSMQLRYNLHPEDLLINNICGHDINFEMQGIFVTQAMSSEEYRIYGLTRGMVAFRGEVKHTRLTDSRPLTCIINYWDLANLHEGQLKTIWKTLGDLAGRWHKTAAQREEQAKSIVRKIELDDLLFRMSLQ